MPGTVLRGFQELSAGRDLHRSSIKYNFYKTFLFVDMFLFTLCTASHLRYYHLNFCCGATSPPFSINPFVWGWRGVRCYLMRVVTRPSGHSITVTRVEDAGKDKGPKEGV